MQLKGIVLAAVLSIAYLIAAQAYTPDSEHNGLRPGDSLRLRQINYVDTVTAGKYKLWNLTGLQVQNLTGITIGSISEQDDTLECVVARTRYIYSVAGDTVRYEGFENNLSDIMADRAENVLIFPLRFHTTYVGEFSGSGRYADRLCQEMQTAYSVCADACGTLVMPEGDTIRNVLRLRTIRNINDKFIPLNINLTKCYT